MQNFTISTNQFLQVPTRCYYRTYYRGYRKLGNPDYLNDLKNTFNNTSLSILLEAKEEVKRILIEDIPQVMSFENLNDCVCVCVPRSRADFSNKQQYFRLAISEAALQLDNVKDGSNLIKRVVNTCTTHLRNSAYFDSEGSKPYVGITKDTCFINGFEIKGKDVILIDDIYTRNVNIDEDCIQALINEGARKVILYVIAYTKKEN